MRYNKTQIIFVLFGALAVLYAVNIFLTKGVFDVLVDAPAKISFTIIEPPENGCESCFDANKIVKMVDTAHDIKYKAKSMSYDNVLSQKYIEMYGIKNLPAVVVSGDIANEKVVSAWSALSGREKDGRIIIENLLPYYDVESGEVKGVVSALLIKDDTCKECFDENTYINIIERFGMVIGNKTTYDVASNEGKSLIKEYAITKIPTLILSPNTRDYPNFESLWKEVGTIEGNGWFVFREVQRLSPQYKQL